MPAPCAGSALSWPLAGADSEDWLAAERRNSVFSPAASLFRGRAGEGRRAFLHCCAWWLSVTRLFERVEPRDGRLTKVGPHSSYTVSGRPSRIPLPPSSIFHFRSRHPATCPSGIFVSSLMAMRTKALTRTMPRPELPISQPASAVTGAPAPAEAVCITGRWHPVGVGMACAATAKHRMRAASSGAPAHPSMADVSLRPNSAGDSHASPPGKCPLSHERAGCHSVAMNAQRA